MNIPKVIHYCWLGGGGKPAEVERCILSWKKYLPDYQIIEWNESNIDIETHPYLERMYRKKMYAFASDYIRLMVLKKYGGIYFDTDILVFKNFDKFLTHTFFIGFMFDCALGTAVIGSVADCPVVVGLLKVYDENAGDRIVNNTIFTNYFLQHIEGFRLNGKYQQLGGGIHVYPRECFEFCSSIPILGYSRHLALNTWRKGKSDRSNLKRLANALLGDVLYGKLVHAHKLKTNEFYPIYRKHIRRGSPE